MAEIKAVKIHPSIGVARVGNGPTDFFVGPERPGDSTPPPGGYRDAESRIKRQAARFRLLGYSADGKVLQELTARDAEIAWTVHPAKQKAAGRKFDGLNPKAPWRNPHIKNRKSLIIDPGRRVLRGPGQLAAFDTGTFRGTPVPLGEARTDEEDRLLVLGGFGHSASPTNAPSKPLRTTTSGTMTVYPDVTEPQVAWTRDLVGSEKGMVKNWHKLGFVV